MALTVVLEKQGKLNNMMATVAKITFDSSYPTGGESLTAAQVGLTSIFDVIPHPQAGYDFEYDYTNSKLKAFVPVGAVGAHTHAVALDTGASAAEAAHTHPVLLDTGASAAGSAHTHAFTGTAQAPVLVVEEVQAVASNTCTLTHVPLYIVAVEVTAGGVTGAFNVIPTGKTPLTTQVAVTFTTGVLTFLGTDAVTSVRVTYLPKRGSGYLSAVTVDETVVAAAAGVNLAARAGLVQYVWNETDSVLHTLEPPGEQPSATHTAVVDINNSSNTTIDTHVDDDADSLKVTYVPFSQLAPGTFVDDTDITLSSQVWNFTGDPTVLGYHNLVVPGLGTQLVGEATATNQRATWVGPSGTAANAVAKWDPARNTITTAMTTPMTTTAISWMVLDPLQLTPATPAGTNANESTHTHGPGTLADAATGAGSSHTHGPGTLADAASGTGGAIAATAGAEVANATDLSAVTVRVLAIGM